MAYEKELIEYLSKEIETHTNSLMTFRSRFSFAGLFGPFLLIGSVLVATRQIPGQGASVPAYKWLVAGVFLFLSYLALSWAGATVERHVWRQCNKWRALIARISEGKSVKLTEAELKFDDSLRLGYLFSFLAMGFAFVGAVFMIRYLRLG